MTKHVVWASYFENLVTAHVLANLNEEAITIAKERAVLSAPAVHTSGSRTTCSSQVSSS